MRPIDSRRLGHHIRQRRLALGYSARDLAKAAGVDVTTIVNLENARVPHPRPDSLKAIAGGLRIRVSDLFATAAWVPSNELPSLLPYLRAKYRDLPDHAIEQITRYTERIRLEHGDSGPLDGEDET